MTISMTAALQGNVSPAVKNPKSYYCATLYASAVYAMAVSSLPLPSSHPVPASQIRSHDFGAI